MNLPGTTGSDQRKGFLAPVCLSCTSPVISSDGRLARSAAVPEGGRSRSGLLPLQPPVPYQGREARDLRGPGEPERDPLRNHVWQGKCGGDRPHREETPVPLPARDALVFARQRRVQFPLRALPELAHLAAGLRDDPCRSAPPGRGTKGPLCPLRKHLLDLQRTDDLA
ncbi:MAG: hypothetical protein BWY93_01772 [Euryarchaeota archaeon ADurb.BinA087]|nr:MAG: hypothetical protein BWY93_01772 [Euryarchaeota archaeon ADurb.BinA087]